MHPRIATLLLPLLAVGASSPLAGASPASDLFERALAQVNRYYNGYSEATAVQPTGEVRATLRQRCRFAPQRCSASIGSALLTDYVADFYDDHMFVMTPKQYAVMKGMASGRVPATPTFGFTTDRLSDTQAVVLDVARGGPAERAGLQPGDRILRANGGPVPLTHPPDSFPRLRLKVARGPVKRAAVRTVTLTRASLAPLYLPQLYVPVGAPKGVMVLRIPNFQYDGQVGPRVHQLVHEAQARGARGLILDLRGGPGGNIYECEAAAGALVGPFQFKLQSKLGTFAAGWTGSRSPDGADRAFKGVEADWQNKSLGYRIAHPARWTGKTAVLVDEHTGSCHEYFAYVVQQFGHAKVIGESTYGVLNTYNVVLELADGGALLLPAFRTMHTDGTTFPRMLKPDVVMFPDPQYFADTGIDPMLQMAYTVLGLAKAP